MTLLTVRDIAERSGLSLETVIKIVQRGEVEAVVTDPPPHTWDQAAYLYPDTVVSEFFSKERVKPRMCAAAVIAADLRMIIGWIEANPSGAFDRTVILWNRVTRRSRRRRVLNLIKRRNVRTLGRTGQGLLPMDLDPHERR